MKETRAKGKRSLIAYDTLYIDGRPVRDKGRGGGEIGILSWIFNEVTNVRKVILHLWIF
ncbi:hypothetical protein DPMN_119841 [Dreissena polymorpha]|uniref:Uncharacterized protein n=1 Tax=Dreissena polymorpha TaxID=45954 RepID=A0A9D4JN47_DREPO|nr:hypothetical protein DPMN_119841 [Dreissena polymorpha]